jgi:hypothetical protein
MGFYDKNHCVSGLCPLSGILKYRKRNILELNLLPFSGEGMEKATLLLPLERFNHYHWTIHVIITAAI